MRLRRISRKIAGSSTGKKLLEGLLSDIRNHTTKGDLIAFAWMKLGDKYYRGKRLGETYRSVAIFRNPKNEVFSYYIANYGVEENLFEREYGVSADIEELLRDLGDQLRVRQMGKLKRSLLRQVQAKMEIPQFDTRPNEMIPEDYML